VSASEGSGGELSQPHRATTRERTVATLRAGLKEKAMLRRIGHMVAR